MEHTTYEIAVHEAGHAVMAITQMETVSKLMISDTPDEEGTVGFCRHTVRPGSVFSHIQIALAGPCMSAIHEHTDLSTQFGLRGGSSDFDKAYEIALDAVAQSPARFGLDPAQVAPFDDDTLYEIAGGNWPSSTSGVDKRRLRRFAKKHVEAISWATTTVHADGHRIMADIQADPHFIAVVHTLARELSEVRKMSLTDICNCLIRTASFGEGIERESARRLLLKAAA